MTNGLECESIHYFDFIRRAYAASGVCACRARRRHGACDHGCRSACAGAGNAGVARRARCRDAMRTLSRTGVDTVTESDEKRRFSARKCLKRMEADEDRY
ncbi:hypothetical protein A8H31_06085 [Burkholderia thailandensis]|nr:hypothetical protein A8H31_06085 [Burkholderia thailandensis]NOK41196.1 hypothetical protein [Burkholderia thailandensis]NOK51759.1 hypothetical protein [Burkholderia thailandensis]PNE71244.1 hypothetical protein A8H38_03015 [Burkholderia thailandensis]PNE83143.1 hypothetical protein A8H34_02465 [Burkholderia thailandensis]